MIYLLAALGFLFAMTVTMLLIPAVRHVAFRQRWVDEPDGKRKFHARTVPTLGGVAMALGYAVGVGYLFAIQDTLAFAVSFPSLAVGIGAVIMVATGIYDDVHGLGFKVKFVIQIAVAYLLLHSGYRIDISGIPFIEADPYQLALYEIPVTILWIVGLMNAVNLIDGLDGLAAGVVIIAFASLSMIFGIQGGIGTILPTVVLIGAIAGFLVYNFNPASIFMGDSGSLFLGFMLAAYSLEGQAHVEPVAGLLIMVVALGLPLFDVGFSIIRRACNGKSVFAPDNDHIHHRLKRRWSTRSAVLVLYVVSTVLGFLAFLMAASASLTVLAMFGMVFTCACLGVYWLGKRVPTLPSGTTRAFESTVRMPTNGVESKPGTYTKMKHQRTDMMIHRINGEVAETGRALVEQE